MGANIARRLAAEFIGTAGLLCAIVGSGIMAERLANGNDAVALIANILAISSALAALILTFAHVSGAHFNPVVSLHGMICGTMKWSDTLGYAAAQILGALLGVALANLMFDLPPFFAAAKMRTGFGQWLGEFIATFGLIGVIISVSRRYNLTVVALAVAAYIMAAVWFTSSTSFANPAVTIARSLSDTFTGIRPVDVPGFIVAQVLGAVAGSFVFRRMIPVKVEEL